MRLTLPTRSTDETDDPYSTVLFSDIRPLLVPLKTVQAKRVFRLIWLSFLGLHIPGFSMALSDLTGENWDDRWCYTFLTRPPYLRTLFPKDVMTKRLLSDAQSGAIVGGERTFSKGIVPIKNWDYGIIGVHEGLMDANWTKRDVERMDDGFVRRIFQQCRVGGDDREWDSFAIEFENALSNKRSATVALQPPFDRRLKFSQRIEIVTVVTFFRRAIAREVADTRRAGAIPRKTGQRSEGVQHGFDFP